jgi:hypothetical protein
MKKAMLILLCLTSFSCSRYVIKEEKVRDINMAVQQYYDEIKWIIDYYHGNRSLDTLTLDENLNWNIKFCQIKPAQVYFNGEVMTYMAAKGMAAFTNQPATQYGDYYFHLSHASSYWLIYTAFQDSKGQWLMLAIPVPTY